MTMVSISLKGVVCIAERPVTVLLSQRDSSAIMKYLANKHKVPDHWYPSDTKMRAKVDEYLFWHASNLRAGAAQQFFSKVSAVVELLQRISVDWCF